MPDCLLPFPVSAIYVSFTNAACAKQKFQKQHSKLKITKNDYRQDLDRKRIGGRSFLVKRSKVEDIFFKEGRMVESKVLEATDHMMKQFNGSILNHS